MLEHTDTDELWLMLSPQNPLKPSATLLNEYNRLHLCNLATKDLLRIKPSSIEFTLPRPSFTVDTMAYLIEQYPQHQFSIVMGGDSLQNIARWKNYEVLLANYPIMVYNRPGFTAPDLTKMADARIAYLDAPLLDISASYIRAQVKLGKSIKFLVPAPVEEEIKLAGYYRDNGTR